MLDHGYSFMRGLYYCCLHDYSRREVVINHHHHEEGVKRQQKLQGEIVGKG